MSEFSVVTSQIQEMSLRLGTIGPETADLCSQMGTHASAAAQTPADGALNDVMGQWAAALPRFGLSGDRLGAAMSGAAVGYEAADRAVAEAASGAE